VKEPTRIVSLLASGTELVCRLGLGERLVGRSHECDFPEWVRRLPEVSRPTFDIRGSSREIDENVRRCLKLGQPLYEVDESKLLELAPDMLISQTHCEVCAVSPGNVKLARQPLVALSGGTLRDILNGFVVLAEALGRPNEGAKLVHELTAELARVSQLVRDLPRPRVACVEWIEPLFAMGNWGPELVELAGGENLLGKPGVHSTTVSWETIRAADPDVLIVAPCGFGLPRAQSEMHLVSQQPGFTELRAARAERVFVCDGNLFFNRSSPSLFETATILGELLHPARFEPEHRDKAWVRWSA
jgi:iron complex transport system substrate-binding protein